MIRDTGSASSIGFVRSYGRINGAMGAQIFRERYAPRYKQSFASAMGVVVACVIVTLVTWSEARRMERVRAAAGAAGLAVLDDVVDRDLKGRVEVW